MAKNITKAKNISILGSTGSIGTQALDVVREVGDIKVFGLTANSSIELLEKQVREFKPEIVCVMDNEKAEQFKKNISDLDIEVVSGLDGLIKVAAYDNIDTVLNSVVGNIGLKPTVEAIKAHKNICLANKETLVTGGEIVMKLVEEYDVNLYPVDSEHSAIFQCLQGNKGNKISKILLTASGGPFRTKTDLENVTINDALHHPNWSMGKKITVDSATLMNKGLEIIEAKWLFNLDLEQIEVVVHPQSIVHSMVEYEDGAVIAQLGMPDMRVPIQYALTYPARVKNSVPRLNFFEHNNLTFEKPRIDDFPCLKLALSAIKQGGTMPTVMNAANEVAVEYFIKGKIKFMDIPRIISDCLTYYKPRYEFDVDDLLNIDKEVRVYAYSLAESTVKNM